jgi:hypothetical protein
MNQSIIVGRAQEFQMPNSSWLGVKTRNKGAIGAPSSPRILEIRCFWISTRFNSPKASTRSASTDYEVKLHGDFCFKSDLPVG